MHTVGDTSSSVPAFLGKLWKLVEDPSTNHLISWNPNGVSFTIRDQARFARELLPLYYKHNNMASFVRQLNMYGFHKVVSVDSGGLKVDKDEMEFAHMYFLQGQEFLLEHIKRKIPISKQEDGKHAKPEVLTRVLAEVRGLKGKQENVDSRLAAMKSENQALWREVAALRQKHMKQQQIVNKLIQFLISVVQPNRAGLGLKRRYPLMLGEAARPTSSSPSSSTDSKTGGKNNVGASKIKQDSGRKDLGGIDLSNMPTMLLSSTSGGPTIHDVTDIIDDVESELIDGNVDEGNVVEAEDSLQSPIQVLPETLVDGELSDVSANINEAAAPPAPANEELPIEGSLAEELSATEQPDFNTMVELEESAGSGASPNLLDKAMAGIASPLSPELLNAVDPRVINDGALLSFEKNRNGKGKTTNSAETDKPDLSVAGIPVMERDELDTHLDTMQMDLDQLREVLSMHGSPLDAATLLGVCDSMGLNGNYGEPTMGVDSFNYPSNTGPSPAWNRGSYPSDSGVKAQSLWNSLLEHQLLPKLFSADETLAGNSYMSMDFDMFRSPPNGTISGNEVIAYGYPGMLDDDQAYPMAPENMQSDIATATVDGEGPVDLLDLLAEPPAETDTNAGAAPTKRKKRN